MIVTTIPVLAVVSLRLFLRNIVNGDEHENDAVLIMMRCWCSDEEEDGRDHYGDEDDTSDDAAGASAGWCQHVV